MLLLGSRLKHLAIMGLQTGSELARTVQAVIDPADLRIHAYIVKSPLIRTEGLMVRIADIRELSDIGFIIDSAEEFIAPGDVIKIDELVELGFIVDGMLVTDEKKHKLGRIIDYTLDTDTFLIQQLTVKRPLFKSFNDTELLIHRSQIIEINNKSIVVHSRAEVPEHTALTTPGAYVNPFRKPKPSESRDNS